MAGDWIGGEFVPVVEPDGELKDVCPGDTNEVVGIFPFKRNHMLIAAQRAKEAFLPWAKLPLGERLKFLQRLKEIFQADLDRLALAISRDTGKPLWESQTEASALISKIDITVNESLKLVQEVEVPNALPGMKGKIHFKPRGVMAVIGPFNFPLHLPNGHIVPALALGNTVVFKPSEQTPYCAQVYAECFAKAQFPPGVFNMVQGDGESGRTLVLAEEVDGVLFTGSYEVGLKIKQETLTHYWKILALEMGGKNAAVVLDDAPLDLAIYECLVGAFLTAGQRCSGTSRILVHEKIYDSFVDGFYRRAKKIKIGHYRDSVFYGPLIQESAVEKYLRFQEIARREGTESLMRGKALENVSHPGYYVSPSINLVQKFDSQSVYHKTEIFGPNVAIFKIKDYEETIPIVNSTGFGLVASLFTMRSELVQKATLDYKVGLVNWNRATNGASSRLPFGGMLKSGNDRPSAHFAVYYCSIPMGILENPSSSLPDKILTGIDWNLS